jgi:hypothetical protein
VTRHSDDFVRAVSKRARICDRRKELANLSEIEQRLRLSQNESACDVTDKLLRSPSQFSPVERKQ